ncbi:MAG: FtsX-like permease family protein [bacterium]|nr:FtsX-like permease family protein [bacterium]
MSVPFFIARRYLRPQRFSFITIISLSSVLGIVIGTAALIIVMSLFNGFRNMASEMLVGFGPHMRVEMRGENSAQANSLEQGAASAGQGAASANAKIAAHAKGAFVVPVYASKLVIVCRGMTNAVQGIGLEENDASKLVGIRRSVVMGEFLTVPLDNMPSIVLAAGVAEKMQVLVGDTVQLYAPEMIEQAMTGMIPSGRPTIVRGVFQSNTSRDVDYTYAYLDAKLMRALTKRDEPTYFDVYLPDATGSQETAEALQAELGPSAHVRSWEQLNQGITDTMKLERIGAFIVLMLIVVVAVFNVLVSLTLSVVEKRRDIAILRTVGFTSREVGHLYLLQGILIGCVSVTLGVLLGVGVAYGQIYFGWVRFDPAAGYLIAQLPMDVHAEDVALTAIVALVLASLAAIYPSRRAASLVVAEALRSE